MVSFVEEKRRALEDYLRRQIQGEVRFDLTSRRLYSTDASIYQIVPLGVVIPRSTDDVVTAVQIASEMQVPITARGGGTSLSGQSIGPGIVLDFSKYLNAILDIDPVGKTVMVQPGVVLEQLNRELAPRGLQFGPEVATASRANLGGMIGNNSAGSRSIVYGKTIDHVRRLRVLLADGSQADVGPVSDSAWERRAAAPTFEGSIYRQVARIVRDHAVEIERRFPRILRRVSGYNLDALCPGYRAPLSKNGRRWFQPISGRGLHQLVVGSEGTLAVTLAAELQVIPRPRERGLLLPHFSSLSAAMDAVAACLEFEPSAVELMDQMLLDLARENLSLRGAMAAIEGRPAAIFMVEFIGDDRKEIVDRVERLKRRLQGVSGLTAVVPALDPAVRDPLWALRSGSMPLLYGVRGDRKPVTCVEDTAVSPKQLPEFVARFRALLHEHGTDGAFYGHASVGCLHIRPLLDLKNTADVARMRCITEKVADLVLEFGGALSGEHGDGLARSEWNRKMFGDEVYEAFRAIKHAFDPDNLLNPGRVVDAPAMTENMRYGPEYRPDEPETVFSYDRQEGAVRSIEMCNGNGACRKLAGGTMCPSFRATRDEKDSTRGRANALRLALSGEQKLGVISRPKLKSADQRTASRFRDPWVYDVLDLCLMCKACKSECPSNVDMAKWKAEFLQHYYEGRLRPLGHYAMGRIYQLNRLGALAAPVANWLQSRRPLRWLLEKFAGIDRRRSLPLLYAHHFRRWLSRHTPPPNAGRYGRVLLLDDCLTSYNEPHIGRAAVRVLEYAGYTVVPARLPCCGRALISKGFLREARALILEQLPRLAKHVAEGLPLLGLEPSCLLTIADEWPELLPGEETSRVAAAAELAESWLAKAMQQKRCDVRFSPRAETCVVHGHCHQKALVGTGGTLGALRMIPELAVEPLDTGCCGMAGSFGFEREHYDLSVAIARQSLVPELEKAPEALVVAPGTSCRHQIKDLTRRMARHPMEVLLEQIAKA